MEDEATYLFNLILRSQVVAVIPTQYPHLIYKFCKPPLDSLADAVLEIIDQNTGESCLNPVQFSIFDIQKITPYKIIAIVPESKIIGAWKY
jgi:hypothetical protein